MQLTKRSSVRHGATDLGQRPPIGPLSVLSVGNRGWLVALVWARAKGESKMIARFGMVLYRCGLVIAFLCGLAALTILAAILTNKLPDSEAWIAAVSFAVVGGLSWLAGRAAKNALTDI
jgi:hypothetical protein